MKVPSLARPSVIFGVLPFVVLGTLDLSTGSKKVAARNCSCVLQWIYGAGIAGATARKYEKIVDSVGLPITQIGKMNPVVFGLVLHGNVNDARKIQLCIKSLSAKCRRFNPCQTGGMCLPASKGRPSACRCAKGLTGCLCKTDIDECQSRKLNECDDPKRALCTNTHGSYVCSCRRGYGGNGRKCIDVNECNKKSHKCDRQAICTNTAGSYSCKCRSPYTGNGFTCTRDLCAGNEKSAVCKEVKTLRAKVSTLERNYNEQRRQTRLLTNVITQFLTRTAKLDKRLTDESARITQQTAKLNLTDKRLTADITKLQTQCTGLHSSKQFIKHTTSNFHNWHVTYNKKRKDTSLRVSYSGMLGVRAYYNSHIYCTRVDILFNGNACSNPSPITSGFVFEQRYSNWYTRTLAPSILRGYCNGFGKGSMTIAVRITNACTSSKSYNYNGGSWYHLGKTTFSLNVEEHCP